MKENIKQLLQKLVSFASISSENNRDLVNWIRHYAQPFVNEIKIIPQINQEKESILLKVGSGSGGLVLSGHLDVVPVIGQLWNNDPFSLIEIHNKYYGRGVADMKGFIACALALLPKIKNLENPLFLSFTCDEEIGCLAAPQMVDILLQEGAKDAFVWVGEPTSLLPVVGQKGITNLKTTVYGKAAHSSQIAQGLSAIHIASQLIIAAEKLMYKLKEIQQNPRFNVPFTSIHVGKISGGTAINITAEKCYFEWEIRHLPETSFTEVFQYFQDICDDLENQYPYLKIKTELMIQTVAALKNQHQEEWLALLRKYLPYPAHEKYVAYATEAGFFQQNGFQTLICGPGSISQAHQANEWIETEQLQLCYKLMQNVITERCQATFIK